MRKLSDVRVVVSCGLALIGGLLLVGLNQVQARPKYRSVFKKTYPKVASSNKVTCLLCHVKEGEKINKKKRNNYGQALKTSLGKKKNIKDTAAIEKALKKTETAKSAVEGKTFGDLLKAGKLPTGK